MGAEISTGCNQFALVNQFFPLEGSMKQDRKRKENDVRCYALPNGVIVLLQANPPQKVVPFWAQIPIPFLKSARLIPWVIHHELEDEDCEEHCGLVYAQDVPKAQEAPHAGCQVNREENEEQGLRDSI